MEDRTKVVTHDLDDLGLPPSIWKHNMHNYTHVYMLYIRMDIYIYICVNMSMYKQPNGRIRRNDMPYPIQFSI